MKKSILRNSFIAVLLLGNIILLTNYFMRPPHLKHEGPRNEIIAILHFDNKQVEKYDVLIKQHQRDIRNAEKELITAKNKLYADLDQSIDTILLNDVSEKQAVIEKTHYKHFQDIKKLCKPEQQVYFKELNRKIALLFSHRMKPRK